MNHENKFAQFKTIVQTFSVFWRLVNVQAHTFLAATVNVFPARREPTRFGLHPAKLRPSTFFARTFLPARTVLSQQRK